MNILNQNRPHQLTKRQMDLLPSEEDVQSYEKNGWYVSPVILTNEEIESAIKGCEQYYNGIKDIDILLNDHIANDSLAKDMVLKNNEFVAFQKNEIRDIAFHPLVAAIAGMLSRTDEIRYLADSLLTKKPSKENDLGVVGWHTDKAYWPTLSSNDLLTAWIPFQDCTEDMGPVLYIDESHLWRNHKDFKSYYSFTKENLKDFEKELVRVKPNYKKTAMAIKKGQVCFHNCNTIHCSLPNTSQKDRIALAVHLQDGKNEYQKAYKENGDLIVISYDKICTENENGEPNYRDQNIFPVLYQS